MDPFSLDRLSGMVNIVPYFRVYFFHAFYLIAFQYLGEHRKQNKGQRVSLISSVAIFLNTILYGIMDAPSLRGNPDIHVAYNLYYEFGRFLLVFL